MGEHLKMKIWPFVVEVSQHEINMVLRSTPLRFNYHTMYINLLYLQGTRSSALLFSLL